MEAGETSGPDYPLVTVVIPTLNEAGRIEACLASVLAQDYPSDRMEIIVADGGSTDGSREKVTAFAEHHPQVRLVANPKRIQAAAFNLGVRDGRGEVVVRLDAHAAYAPDYLRRCVEVLDETGAANAGGICRTRPGADTLLARTVALVATSRFGAGAARFRSGGEAGPVDTVPFGAFPRSTFERAGLMDERLARGEDNEFNARIRQHGLTVYFDPRIRCTYYARATVRGFLRQMFANGLYHVLTLRVNPGGCSPRHFVPLLFVLALLGCGVGGLFWTPAWYAGAAVLALYGAVDLSVSLRAAARNGWAYLAVLPWLLALTHIAYGAGTLVGAFRFGLASPKRAPGGTGLAGSYAE